MTCQKYMRSENNNFIKSDLLQIMMWTIALAGFSQQISWMVTVNEHIQDQHMPLFELANKMILPRSLIPEWLLNLGHWVHIPILGPTLRAIQRLYNNVKFGILEIVSKAQAQIPGGKTASLDAVLLKNMVEVNMNMSASEEDVRQLTDNELLSNLFVSLLAITVKTEPRDFCLRVSVRFS